MLMEGGRHQSISVHPFIGSIDIAGQKIHETLNLTKPILMEIFPKMPMFSWLKLCIARLVSLK